MEKEFLNPAGMPSLAGFSQVVTATEGKIVFISGQIAFNEKNEPIIKCFIEEGEEQTETPTF